MFQVPSTVTVTPGENSVSAELSSVANYADNDATFKCEVSHPALPVPLTKTQKLKVSCEDENELVSNM